MTGKIETLVLNAPPNPYFNKSSYRKKYLSKFSYPKKIPKSKISNPKKSIDHPCHLKSGVPPPPPPGNSSYKKF